MVNGNKVRRGIGSNAVRAASLRSSSSSKGLALLLVLRVDVVGRRRVSRALRRPLPSVRSSVCQVIQSLWFPLFFLKGDGGLGWNEIPTGGLWNIADIFVLIASL